MKKAALLLFLFLETKASIIERPQFISGYYDSANGLLVHRIRGPTFKVLNFYRCDRAQDIGNVEKSTFLGAWFLIDSEEEVSFLPANSIGFHWIEVL